LRTQAGGDRRLLRRLLWETCQSVQWRSGVGTPIAARLDTALAAHTLHVRTTDVELRARLTKDVALAIAVEVRTWSEDAEASLSMALDQDESLMAALVKAEWKLVRTACKAAYRTAGKLLLLTTIPEA
jgi:hypothetical protein